MSVRIELVATIGDLIQRAHQADLKRVLLTSYGSVEPQQVAGAWVLAGMTTVVVTALDTQTPTVHRWEQKGRSKGSITVHAGTGRGRVSEGEPMARLRDDVYELLRDEGFEVDEGEWTPELAERSLKVRKSFIG